MKLPLTAAFFCLLMAMPAMAIGISPGRYEMDFIPNFDGGYSFTVINNINESRNISISATGELAKYITFDRNGTFPFEPIRSQGFNFYVKLPESLEPGKNEGRIRAVEVAQAESGVGGVAGVELQFWVKVPYPEKYIRVGISTQTTKPGEPALFDIVLTNPSAMELLPETDLEVQDENHTLLDRFELGPNFVPSGSQITLHASWTPTAYGSYYALVRARYDGLQTKKEAGFALIQPPTSAAVMPENPPESPQPDLSFYAFLIVLLVVCMVIVAFWPKKRKGEQK